MAPTVPPSIRPFGGFGSTKGQGSSILVTPMNSSFTSRGSGGSLSRGISGSGSSSLSRSSGSMNRTSSPRSGSFGGGFGSAPSSKNVLPSSSNLGSSSSTKSSSLISSSHHEKENTGSREPRPSGVLGAQLANQLEKVFERLATLEDHHKTTTSELTNARVTILF